MSCSRIVFGSTIFELFSSRILASSVPPDPGFFGSVTLARLNMTSSAVRVLPLWNSTPSRSRTVHCVLSPFGVTASATDGSISYWAFQRSSGS